MTESYGTPAPPSGVGTDDAVASYLASVRAALADLPPVEVEEILDDVGPHVAEVAQELGEEDLAQRLRERLGDPEQYAAELRAAAGYPPRPEQPSQVSQPGTGLARAALWMLVVAVVLTPVAAPSALDPEGILILFLVAALAGASLLVALRAPGGVRAVGELPELRRLRASAPRGALADYGRLFQPAWWLVRAAIAAALVIAVFGPGGGGLAVAALTVPLAIGSAWVGRRSQVDRRWLWAVLPLNAFALAAGLVLLDRVPFWQVSYVQFGDSPPTVMVPPPYGNIYPFDSNGKPLTGVYLYDENGQPITPGYGLSQCAPTGGIPVPANQYPQPVYEYDATGRCVVRSSAPAPPELPTEARPTPSGPAASSPADPSLTVTPTG